MNFWSWLCILAPCMESHTNVYGRTARNYRAQKLHCKCADIFFLFGQVLPQYHCSAVVIVTIEFMRRKKTRRKSGINIYTTYYTNKKKHAHHAYTTYKHTAKQTENYLLERKRYKITVCLLHIYRPDRFHLLLPTAFNAIYLLLFIFIIFSIFLFILFTTTFISFCFLHFIHWKKRFIYYSYHDFFYSEESNNLLKENKYCVALVKEKSHTHLTKSIHSWIPPFYPVIKLTIDYLHQK